MCELLIKASTNNSPQPWRAGMVVTVKPDGHEWGSKETAPAFYLVKVPGVSVETATQYLEEWNHKPVFELLSEDLVTDTHTYKMTVKASSIKGALTLSQVDNYFTKWGCEITDNTLDSITFTANIFNIIKSNGFWGRDVSGLGFVDSYDTNSHTVTVTGATAQQIERACSLNGVTYVPPLSYRVNRNQAKKAMADDIYQQFNRIVIERRRWYLSNAAMSALASAGGVMTVSAAQLLQHLKDGFAD